MVKFTLKLGKDNIEVEHIANEPFEDFQAKVFTLTDIPPKNLKILFKAKMIKDNQALLALPEGSALIIMGTKSGKQLKQSQSKIQSKKMQEEEVEIQIPPRFGLVNIGNTCYMNAALQLLRSIPQLNQLIKNFKITNNAVSEQGTVKIIGNLFKNLQAKDFTPEVFVQNFLLSHPDYLPLGTQHDSDEFMQQIIGIMIRSNPEIAKNIKELFEIEFIDVTKNLQIQQEPKHEVNASTKLCCSIGGVQKQLKIGTLNEGIRLSLETKLQKISKVDNLNHHYQKITKFNTLPPYMLVQMVRFFWKQASDLPHSKPTAAKICKSIDFGHRIDIFDFCSQELKATLTKGRDAIEQNKKREQLQYKKSYEAYKESLGDTNRPQKRIMQEFVEKWKKQQKVIKEGLETGWYELVGTVTHLGNSVQSGHYMAWVKQNEQEWTKYDDNTVYQQPHEKVTQLRGGQPNLEIAYVLLFRKVFAKPI